MRGEFDYISDGSQSFGTIGSDSPERWRPTRRYMSTTHRAMLGLLVTSTLLFAAGAYSMREMLQQPQPQVLTLDEKANYLRYSSYYAGRYDFNPALVDHDLAEYYPGSVNERLMPGEDGR